MKAMEIIDRLDGLEPNQYSPEQKLRWLSILDGKIYEEVLRPRETEPKGFTEYVNGNEELLVPFPYGDDVYLNYLQAMVALENAETQRYNKRLQFFNNAYAEYQNWYNRNHSMSDVTDGGVRRHFGRHRPQHGLPGAGRGGQWQRFGAFAESRACRGDSARGLRVGAPPGAPEAAPGLG